jgi:hypothetical protein
LGSTSIRTSRRFERLARAQEMIDQVPGEHVGERGRNLPVGAEHTGHAPAVEKLLE